MSEEIKRKWDDGEIAAVRAWYESEKGFDQVEREINLPCGTLYKFVNEIPDYRGCISLKKLSRCVPVSQGRDSGIHRDKKG